MNPWAHKDEIRMPVFAPVESTRVVRATQRGRSRTESISYPYTQGEPESEMEGEGVSVGRTRSREETLSHATTPEKSRGESYAEGASDIVVNSWSETEMESEQESDTDGSGSGSSQSGGYNLALQSQGNWAIGLQGESGSHNESSRAHTSGRGSGHASTVGGARAHTDSQQHG
jgi:hypothetical protein